MIPSLLCPAAFLCAALAGGPLAAQGAAYVSRCYGKREVRVPMRDGTRLFTVIYTPKEKGRAFPILLNRTPYGVGPYGEAAFKRQLGPSPRFPKEGFITPVLSY